MARPWARSRKEEWAKGVNLATLPTPMAKQAAAVHDLTLRHNVVHFARWRMAGVNLDNIAIPPAHLQAAADALDTLEADVLVEQHAAAQPKSHRYELVAVTRSDHDSPPLSLRLRHHCRTGFH